MKPILSYEYLQFKSTTYKSTCYIARYFLIFCYYIYTTIYPDCYNYIHELTLNKNRIKALEDVLHTDIPLTQHIGISVNELTDTSLSLFAPLENNVNHKSTAFGGSIYSVSVLTGWGLIYSLLQQYDLSGHIVIQESNTKFISPITTDLITQCCFDSTEQYEKFLIMYKRKGIARIRLESKITCAGKNAVLFSGTYVVHR